MPSLLENEYEAPIKHHQCGNELTPTCDVTMHEIIVPYSNDVFENSLVQWNVRILRLPRENVSTMSPALAGRHVSSVDIFWQLRCANVMSWHYWTILTGPGLDILFTSEKYVCETQMMNYIYAKHDLLLLAWERYRCIFCISPCYTH